MYYDMFAIQYSVIPLYYAADLNQMRANLTGNKLKNVHARLLHSYILSKLVRLLGRG